MAVDAHRHVMDNVPAAIDPLLARVAAAIGSTLLFQPGLPSTGSGGNQPHRGCDDVPWIHRDDSFPRSWSGAFAMPDERQEPATNCPTGRPARELRSATKIRTPGVP
jgi:hypothetical protein